MNGRQASGKRSAAGPVLLCNTTFRFIGTMLKILLSNQFDLVFPGVFLSVFV